MTDIEPIMLAGWQFRLHTEGDPSERAWCPAMDRISNALDPLKLSDNAVEDPARTEVPILGSSHALEP